MWGLGEWCGELLQCWSGLPAAYLGYLSRSIKKWVYGEAIKELINWCPWRTWQGRTGCPSGADGMWMSRKCSTLLTGPTSKRCLLKMPEICYFLIAQTYSCRSLHLSCLGQPHGFLSLEKPWVVQSCWKRLSWDWAIDFLKKNKVP